MKRITRKPLLPSFEKRLLCLLALLIAFAVLQSSGAKLYAAAEGPVRFKVGLATGLGDGPVSGRLLIFMTNKTEAMDVVQPDFLDAEDRVFIAAAEIRNLEPGKTVDINPDALAYPVAFSKLPPSDYQVMVLLDRDHSYNYSGMEAGDLRSEVVKARSLKPAATASLELTLSKRVESRSQLADTESIKLVTFESPSLSAFWGRSINMRAGIVLPPNYARSQDSRYPVAYNIHGFGGTHSGAWQQGPSMIKKMGDGALPEMIYVFLDASWPLGHHEFADSVNNGPWGRALTTEFIPHLENKFRMDGTPRGRLLTGHSSGGWSTLWLQITYPDFFGGTWSTSPDPVDFRAFTGPDLTKKPTENFYRRPDGTLRNLIRYQGRDIATMEKFARMERVTGEYGGQMASFEAVFSPRGEDGRPMPLFDRDTGAIDSFVQKAWERYDIARIVRDNWQQLGPKLKGKVRVIVGTADNFHLEEGVYLLRDIMKSLGSDAKFEFIEGRDHMDLFKDGLLDRIFREMYGVARPR